MVKYPKKFGKLQIKSQTQVTDSDDTVIQILLLQKAWYWEGGNVHVVVHLFTKHLGLRMNPDILRGGKFNWEKCGIPEKKLCPLSRKW